MNKASTIGLTAAALMACASAASAATVTQTLTFGPQTTAWKHTFSFAPFNPALGTLVKVADTITENLSGSINVTNDGSSSATFTAFLTDTANKTFGGLTTLSKSISNTVTGTLAPGATTGDLPLTGTSTGSGTTTSGLAGFETGPVIAVGTDVGALSFVSDTGNATSIFHDTGEIVDKLVYTYAATVPEPGTLALIGSALAGLAMFRRRKRK